MSDHTVTGLLAASDSIMQLDDGSSWPVRQLAIDGARIASRLRIAGVGPGDRVALRLPNGADYVRMLAACAAGGFVAVSVNTRATDDEAAELVARSGAALFVDGTIEVLDAADGWPTAEPLATGPGADDAFVVFTTSGTTSRPKMVLHRQRSIADHAFDVAAAFGYRPDDTVMVAMPLCGVFGLSSLTSALAAGSRVVLTNYSTERTADLIASERVTCVNGSDDMFHRLLESGAELSSIRLGGYARFNTSLDGIVERAERAGATLSGLYGMSEVQALFSLRDPLAAPRERERAGGTLVSPRAGYRVVDGELHLRGPSLFAGYLAEGGETIDEALTAAHHTDGWFMTGDAATTDDDRTFEYTARLGDVLRLGGFLVAPTEIEAVVRDLPGVQAAQVVAVDRPEGSRPVAFVTGGLDIDESTAIERCAGRLARHKVPVRIVVLDEFPTTPGANGTKIQKVELRRLAAEA